MNLLHSLYLNFFDNPILTRELRRRMRGKALIFSIIGYIVLMSAASILILLASQDPFTLRGSTDTQRMLEDMAETGRNLFMWVTLIQAMLVLIIAPTITAGMTTVEKEKQTFDFLRVTTITPWMYILGCFLSTVFYVGLALLCALPLISLAFLYGGIGRDDVLTALGILMGMSMILSAFGLFISSIRERTRTAQGIVIFLLFTFLFGGMILLTRIRMWLGTAAGLGTGGGGTPMVAGIPVSVAVALGFVAVTAMLLLMATRKLFEPEDARAFSHWQFGLIAGAAAGIFLFIVRGLPLANETFLLFHAMLAALLCIAAGCFAVGRMEVGDEIWHLKRLLPVLRPIDQTIPFLILIGLGAWYASYALIAFTLPGTPGIAAGLGTSLSLVMLLGYALFCVFGRFATAVAVGRRGAGRLTMALMGILWLGVPLLAYMVGGIFHRVEWIQGIASLMGRFSPVWVMMEGIEHPDRYAGAPSFSDGAVVTNAYALGLAIVLFLVLGETRRRRRWKSFDYHYDMPSR